MALLRLAPGIREYNILSMPNTVQQPAISERVLCPIAQIEDPNQQLLGFRGLSPTADS